MTVQALSGKLLTPDGWFAGRLQFDAQLRTFEAAPLADDAPWILPGFIDLHVHGAAGVDLMQGGAAAQSVCRAHARHGTTALLATTMTAHRREIEHALQGVAAAMGHQAPDEAALLGVHLEGPFISPHRLGAQPPLTEVATLESLLALHAIAPIRVLTIASEIEPHLALIPALARLGIRVQLGHSEATYEQGQAALRAGARGFTHLFNGMSGFSHRAPGLVGLALAEGEYAELIPDLQHVHPGALRAALRAIPKAYGVTDATAATGMPDGEYALGPQRVYKCAGCVRLASGSLAGSALTMDQALRNLVAIGLELADAARRLSTLPAEYLNLIDRGRLAPDARADLLVFDAALQLQQVFIAGHSLDLTT